MQLQEGPEQELRKKAMECLKLFLQDQDFLMNEIWRQEMKDRSNAQGILSYWVGFFRDGLFFQEEAKEQLLNVDQPQMIKALGEIPRDRLLSLIQKTMQAEQAILANRDVQLVIENFWVQNKEYGMD